MTPLPIATAAPSSTIGGRVIDAAGRAVEIDHGRQIVGVDVDGHRVRRLIGILAAIVHAAIVLHPKVKLA